MDLTKFNGFSIDMEADGLVFDAKTVWVINCEDLDTGEKLQVTPFKDSKAKDKLERFAAKYSNPNIAFHNGLGYDIFVLMFVMGIDYSVGPDTFFGKPVNFVDTFYLSMYLNPDREKHSLEHWGTIVGMPKIDFRQELIDIGFLDKSANQGQEFLQYHGLMLQYCERDAKVCKLALIKMVSEWRDLYGSWDCNEWPKHFKAGQKSFYLMSCQELAGWKFDIESAYKLKETISKMMEDIKNEVEPKLPPRALKKTEEKEYSIPAKPFKKDGGLSSTMFKWLARHNAEIDQLTFEVVAYGSRYDIIPNLLLDIKKPMEMANQDQMKDWFLSNGWVPTLWNYKKDSDGKPIRDPKTRQPIKTSPKIQEQGKLCENLEKMEGDLVKKVVKWLSLRNRLSVLQGWLDNPRLQYDGRIGAGRTGIAATHRQKHKVVVNVPKASDKVLLGYEFRSLWTSEDGHLIAAGDAAAIEGRVQGHYCWKYDDGETARELLTGDIHSKTAKSIYTEDLKDFDITSPSFSKDDPKFKPYRDRSKNVFYACLPMKTKVLTCDGWKLFDEISIGDNLLTFNSESGVVENDTVLQKHFFDDKKVHRYSNKLDSFECTEDHRWYGWRRSKTKGKPSTKIYGYFEAKNMNEEYNVILTAPWTGNYQSDLSDDDCSMLGWLASDGYWAWSKKENTQSTSGGRKKYVSSNICQADSKFWKDIEALFERIGVDYLKYRKQVPNGNTMNIYKIRSGWMRGFLDMVFTERKDKHDIDWVRLVLRMTRSNLEAFYDAFYKGDGYTAGKSNTEIVYQNIGNIADGVITAMQLLGNGRLSLSQKTGTNKPMAQIRVQKRKHITYQEIEKQDLGTMDTFCLTTNNGSFVIWQDDFIGITGNCLYGAGDAKLASTAGLPESKGKEVSKKFWDANAATAQLKDNLEKYWGSKGKKKNLPAVDGRVLFTRKKSALLNTIFQSCGGITMDYACLFMDKWLGKTYWDDKRRPYYIYKGCIVRRIGYFHDELEYECQEQVATEVSKMIEMSIVKAGEYLKLKVPLAGEGKVGKTWKETH